jgi:hypothetical protein
VKFLIFALICMSLLVGCSAAEPTAMTDATPMLSGDDRHYSLDWKIGADEVVAYKTAMNRVEEASSTISLNIGQVLSDNAIPHELNQQLSNLRLPEVSSLISVLEQNERGNISVRMILRILRVVNDEELE